MESISLSELTNQIRETLQMAFSLPVWIRAEVSECRENNGHCYLEIIEKEKDTDTIIAKSRAVIWANNYRMIKPYFEGSTGETLHPGINVLVAVSVEFSGQYGFNLIIRDIDPTFTIGEMAARRMEIIRQLEADGVIDMNKELKLPALPQRLAVISSETAAGYGDFINQLHSYSFAFYTKLFQAKMQGENADKSIINALEKIFNNIDLFDAVIIIRGGGATTDLSCFDSYNLAYNCSQFPLPIIAGIGHTRDQTILDRVAHTSVKTPTAAAEFFVNLLSDEENKIIQLAEKIQDTIKNRIDIEDQKLELIRYKLKQAASYGVITRKHQIDKFGIRLRNSIKNQINKQQNKIKLLENKLLVQSPTYLLQRGYTITTVNGKRLTSISQLSENEIIKTYIQDGNFESEVKNKVITKK